VKESTATCQKPDPDPQPRPTVEGSPLDNCALLIAHCSFSSPPPFNVAKNGFPQTPFVIESFFRPYGPGRKQVRPVTDAGYKHRKIASDNARFYRTEIVGVWEASPLQYVITVRLCRGFRHQIRCHLAWIGCPVLNDPLYGPPSASVAANAGANAATDGFLALRATGLAFTDPSSGLPKNITLRTAPK
jgi:23S rRNA pseudouridine1911/1915/1917 synthase